MDKSASEPWRKVQDDSPWRKGVVYRRVNRPSEETIAALTACPLADIVEAMGPVLGYRNMMRPDMRPVKTGHRTVGPAVTAFAFPGCNLMMHLAMSLTRPGDVVVVNSFWTYATQMGANAAAWALAHGVAGIVVDGAVRDTRQIGEMGFPVWATTIAGGETQKGTGAGAVNIPISCGGVVVNPGDVVIADDDGVLIVPRDVADKLAPLATKHTAFEAGKLERWSRPGSTPIIENYAGLLAGFGMQDFDCAWDDR